MKVTISHYEFLKQFPDETAARTYLENRRWKGSPTCPHCNEMERVQVRTVIGYFRCLACKQDFTVRTGTIFERSHIPLDKWLVAVWLVVNCKNGVSSYEIMRDLKVTQKSAWFMLHRIRVALKNGTWMKMGSTGGAVEAEELLRGVRQ